MLMFAVVCMSFLVPLTSSPMAKPLTLASIKSTMSSTRRRTSRNPTMRDLGKPNPTRVTSTLIARKTTTRMRVTHISSAIDWSLRGPNRPVLHLLLHPQGTLFLIVLTWLLRLREETYPRWGYPNTLLARNAYSCFLDRSPIRLALSSVSAWRQWDWSKEACDLRNKHLIHVYLSLWFYCLLCVVIDVSLLVVVHVSQPESTASCTATSILPDWVVATQFRLRWSESILCHNRKLAGDLIRRY